jgi:hypothetical protein
MTTLHVARAASLWYPVMLAQERGEISESKGAELLGMSLCVEFEWNGGSKRIYIAESDVVGSGGENVR